ncbi:MAG TPA: M20 family peptidase [Bacteroidales bacterium]|nr:M20 family peptidase [Bacteroidales bacterium]
MKRLFQIILWLIAVLLIVIVVKTLLFRSRQESAGNAVKVAVSDSCVKHLAEAVSFPTVSYSTDSPIDTASFTGYNIFLKNTYPRVFEKLEKQTFNHFGLLFKWQGTDTTLKPVVLMAHYDVVPPGDSSSWERKPFSGYFDGTYIWGRGTLDDKASMISVLEAVEDLLGEGFKPARTIYLSFGYDEEISGMRGAGTIVKFFKKNNIVPEFVLDEGMAVSVGMVPMIKKPVALIGTSEKGYLTVKLTVEMPGGHSSTPEKETSVTLLNRAIMNLVQKQVKPAISGPVNDFINYIGPEMPFFARAIFANKWLLKGLLLDIYTGTASGNAMVRTTTAPTVVSAGIKDNVIPSRAEALVNFRILPGESISGLLAHIRKVIGDDRVIISADSSTSSEPAPVSPVDTKGFTTISLSIRQVYKDVLVAPTLMLGSSDSKFFSAVTSNIYKFAPIVVTSADMERIHGLNERTKADDFKKGIQFYHQVIINSQGK